MAIAPRFEGGSERRHLDFKGPPRRHRKLQANLGGLARDEHLGQRVEQLGVAHELEERQPFRDRAIHADGTREGLIAENRAQLVIHGKNTFDHTGEDCLATARFEAQPLDQLAVLSGGAVERARHGAQLVVGISPKDSRHPPPRPDSPQRYEAGRCAA